MTQNFVTKAFKKGQLDQILRIWKTQPSNSAANHYNEAAEGQNEEMRNLVMTAQSNMRWYLINRVWEGFKATSRSVNWTDFLKMLLT